MQQLGMAGGASRSRSRRSDGPQSYGLEAAEFLVAGHAGTTPQPLAKVASGGELSRIAHCHRGDDAEVTTAPGRRSGRR